MIVWAEPARAEECAAELSVRFPSELVLTLIGVTYLFAIAQNNGTVVLDGATANPRLAVTDSNDATAELFTSTGDIETKSTRADTHFYFNGDLQNSGSITVNDGRLHLNRGFEENRVATVTNTGTFTIANTASGEGGRRFVSNAGDAVTAGGFDFFGEFRVQGASTFTGASRLTVTGGGSRLAFDSAGATGNLFAAMSVRSSHTPCPPEYTRSVRSPSRMCFDARVCPTGCFKRCWSAPMR